MGCYSTHAFPLRTRIVRQAKRVWQYSLTHPHNACIIMHFVLCTHNHTLSSALSHMCALFEVPHALLNICIHIHIFMHHVHSMLCVGTTTLRMHFEAHGSITPTSPLQGNHLRTCAPHSTAHVIVLRAVHTSLSTYFEACGSITLASSLRGNQPRTCAPSSAACLIMQIASLSPSTLALGTVYRASCEAHGLSTYFEAHGSISIASPL